jgi:hypothetical protein
MIAEKLGETEKTPRVQIEKIVRLWGIENALRALDETQRVEADGGLMLPDGSRRRTPGGVFFHLVRQQIPPEIFRKIFMWQGASRKDNEDASTTVPGITWETRFGALRDLASVEKGQVRTVKITVIGRPGRVIERGSFVMTALQAAKIPPLPKGLPVPAQPTTSYTLFISKKQWRKVADAIKDEDDVLIVEGYPHLDEQMKNIAVFASNTTTKNLQSAQRAKQPGK